MGRGFNWRGGIIGYNEYLCDCVTEYGAGRCTESGSTGHEHSDVSSRAKDGYTGLGLAWRDYYNSISKHGCGYIYQLIKMIVCC